MAKDRLRVLLVDSDEGIYGMLRNWADQAGALALDVQWITQYEEALETVLRREHDVYLFDEVMDGPSGGLELLRAAIEQGFQSPIIMLTDRGARLIDIEAMKLGVTDYLAKGEVTPNMLERSIRYALDRARTAEEMTYAATHDLLTGLFNRQYIFDRLAAETHSSKRYGHPLSFCLCDIDAFKKVNDTYGHRAGDDALQGFARVMQKNLRPEDLAGRYGGDEMCIVFAHTPADQAKMAVERLREAFAAESFDGGGDNRFSATASFGLAELTGAIPEEKALFEAADKALYQAKKAGRNCTVIYAP